jgi:hypothetical protein
MGPSARRYGHISQILARRVEGVTGAKQVASLGRYPEVRTVGASEDDGVAGTESKKLLSS